MRLFESKKWGCGDGLGKMFVFINNMLKAPEKMSLLLCSGEVLDDEGYSVRCVPCLSSEEVGAVFLPNKPVGL